MKTMRTRATTRATMTTTTRTRTRTTTGDNKEHLEDSIQAMNTIINDGNDDPPDDHNKAREKKKNLVAYLDSEVINSLLLFNFHCSVPLFSSY
jgi:hypothetical protein